MRGHRRGANRFPSSYELEFDPVIDGVQWQMSKQWSFLVSKARYPAMFGGFGAGKTVPLAAKCLRSVYDYPGVAGVIGHYRLKDLRRSTQLAFFKLMGAHPSNARKHPIIEHYDRQKDAVLFKNGSEIFFLALGDESIVSALRGPNLGHVSIDQGELITQGVWEEFDARIRSPIGPNQINMVGNPGGHDWIWKTYMRNRAGDPDFPMWIVATGENPFLPPDYIESLLKNHSPEWVARYVYGSFEAFQGQVFEEWDENVHVIDPFLMPDAWKIGYGADFGIRNPTVFEGGGIDYDGALIIFDELWKKGALADEFSRVLKDPEAARYNEHRIYSQRFGMDLPIYGDPSGKHMLEGSGRKIYEAYLANDIYITPAHSKGELVGINRMREMMRVDYSQPHPYKQGVMGRSNFYVMRWCPHFIEEITNIRWTEQRDSMIGKQSPKETIVDVDNHCVDAVRYLVTNGSTRVPTRIPEVHPAHLAEWERPRERDREEEEEMV